MNADITAPSDDNLPMAQLIDKSYHYNKSYSVMLTASPTRFNQTS